jgi:tripartite ATP-independent transporter DctP family solute receptor
MTRATRRDVLKGVAALAAAATGESALSAAGATRTLTGADVHVDKYPTVEAVRWMSRRIEEQTDGRLNIKVYHAGQLGRESDTVDLARFGALDIVRVNFAVLTNSFPMTQALALPYVFDSVEHMRRVVDGPVGKVVLSGFEQRDLVGLAIYDAGSRSFYNVRRPIAEPADLKGLKIRVPPSDVFLRMARAFGSNPTPLPFGDVYSALQTHLIDGAENNWRTFHTSRQFEVARYMSHTAHSYSPEALLMSRRTFDSLSAGDKEIVLHAAAESVPVMREMWDRMEADSRTQVLAAGVKLNEVDLGAFQRVAAEVVEAQVRRGGLRKLVDEIRAAA